MRLNHQKAIAFKAMYGETFYPKQDVSVLNIAGQLIGYGKVQRVGASRIRVSVDAGFGKGTYTLNIKPKYLRPYTPPTNAVKAKEQTDEKSGREKVVSKPKNKTSRGTAKKAGGAKEDSGGEAGKKKQKSTKSGKARTEV